MQLLAKALVSGFISVVIVLAASSPLGSVGVSAELAMDVRNACVSLAAGAYEEAQGRAPVTISIYSPEQMNITVSEFTAVCCSGGQSYAAPLPMKSLPFSTSFAGVVNITVSVADGTLVWW